MKERILLILSLLIIISFAGINFYRYMNSCTYMLKKAINREEALLSKMNKKAIYIINEVNTGCRPCSKYEKLKKMNTTDIIFLVPKDYTNIDIENFRKAFNISEKDKIVKISDAFYKAYLACNKDRFLFNILIIIDEKNEIEEIIRF